VHWHAVTNVKWDREQTHKEFETLFRERADGEKLLAQFNNLGLKEAA
jgi:hypothetical protein